MRFSGGGKGCISLFWIFFISTRSWFLISTYSFDILSSQTFKKLKGAFWRYNIAHHVFTQKIIMLYCYRGYDSIESPICRKRTFVLTMLTNFCKIPSFLYYIFEKIANNQIRNGQIFCKFYNYQLTNRKTILCEKHLKTGYILTGFNLIPL